jgi:hypothetical protein
MDPEVVEDQDTSRSRIRVLDFKQTFEPVNKLFAVISPNFHMGINESINCYGRKK